MKALRLQTLILLLILFPLFVRDTFGQEAPDAAKKITVTVVQSKSATITQRYRCRINAHHRIEVRAPADGYLEELIVKEGQAVKKGDLMFRFLPVLHQARLDSELADVQIAQLEFNNTKRLFEQKTVSQDEVQLGSAKLAKARAKADLARVELNFANVRAPFDGMIGRLPLQPGALVLKGETLTTLSDNSLMRAYFNVSEARYLEYMADVDRSQEDPKIALVLANGNEFQHVGKINAIQAEFNADIGEIAFRADFPNPERLLRHGQTGTVIVPCVLTNAILVPQRATFEDQAKRYVYVIDKDNIAHLREIVIQNELEDGFVIKTGVAAGNKIVLDGVRQVHDGDKVEN